ncbi:hypothetical protein J6590_057691 [Homalodisca vitripennis]|nr:hypothetical protein J6590_057691 [Homalodisca vitripennis]
MPPRYPCGSCSIGVKFSGVKCTGPCGMWYHAGCQNIPEKTLKKWTDRELNATDSTTPGSSKPLDRLCTSIDELESSLNENNNLYNLEDNDEKLEMAAKIGVALLEENNLLKEKNIRLEAKLEILEEQVGRMENEENKYLNKIEDLLQNISEIQAQLEREKKLCIDTQNVFEKHDYKQGQLVDNHTKTINHLENIIKNLEKKLSSQETLQSEFLNRTNNESQTEPFTHYISQPISYSSNSLMELAQLKVRQDNLERTVEDLAGQIKNRHTEPPSNSEIQSMCKTQNHKIIKKSMPTKQNNTPSNRGKKNYFSVSLQMAKLTQSQKQYPMVTQRQILLTTNELLKTVGDCQTRTEKQKISCTTQGLGQILENQSHKTQEMTATYAQYNSNRNTVGTNKTENLLPDMTRESANANTTHIHSTNTKGDIMETDTGKLEDIPLSDDEDSELTETRATARKYVGSTSLNTNTGRISNLLEEDLKNLERLKPYSFPPEETPILTTQYMTKSCSIFLFNVDDTCSTSRSPSTQNVTAIQKRLKNKNISFNNFTTTQDNKGNTKIIICFSAKLNNWKKKLFPFLELANECIKFLVLFSINSEENMKEVNLSPSSIREILQVFLQFSSNAYLHRFCLYTQEKETKKTIDRILDDTVSNKNIKSSNKRLGYIQHLENNSRVPRAQTPTTLLAQLQQAQLHTRGNARTKRALEIKGNIISLKSIEYNVSHLTEASQIDLFHQKTKKKYDIINIRTGKVLTTEKTQTQYQFGYDGAHLVELQRNENQNYKLSPNNFAINDNILVSDNTQLLNDLRLYNSIKHLNITLTPDIPLNLVQGVPGCGKTTYIQKNFKPGDLILFPTRDSAIDFKNRFKDTHPNYCKTNINDTFRTLHSFLINSSQHIEKGNQYDRLIIDEALMMHAGKILFAATLSGAKEVLFIGDTNQIPYINRTSELEVKYYKISEIATMVKVLSTSYRCTKSTTAVLSKFYPQGMETTNDIVGELDIQNFEGLENLNLHPKEYTVLAFKQAEKNELIKRGYKASTIHEFQGKQAANIAQTNALDNKELLAFTANNLTTDQLNRKSITINTGQSTNRQETNPHQQQPTTDHDFLDKIQHSKERDKTKVKHKPRTLWNSSFKKNKTPPKQHKVTRPHQNIVMAHQNIDGIKNKIERLTHFLHSHNPDILILTEHGLNSANLENIRIPEYELIGGFTRTQHKKGGVAIFNNKNLKSKWESTDLHILTLRTLLIHSQQN